MVGGDGSVGRKEVDARFGRPLQSGDSGGPTEGGSDLLEAGV